MADKLSEEVVSTQRKLHSSHDPGWNDPPKWANNPTAISNGTPTKRLLNKRVAFPLSSDSFQAKSMVSGQQLLSSNLPPSPVQLSNSTTASHAPLVTPSGVEQSTECLFPNFNKTEILNKTLENFQTMMNNDLDSSKSQEIKKRLELMKNMWNEDKLNDNIQEKVLKISELLMNNNTDEANKLHISLLMDHGVFCNTWISGIRHLILELSLKKLETDSNNQCGNNPVFLMNPIE